MSHKLHLRFSAEVDILVEVGMLKGSPHAYAKDLLEYKDMHRLLGELSHYTTVSATEITPNTDIPSVNARFEYRPQLPLREIK